MHSISNFTTDDYKQICYKTVQSLKIPPEGVVEKQQAIVTYCIENITIVGAKFTILIYFQKL